MLSAAALRVQGRLWMLVVLFAVVVTELIAGPAIAHARSHHHHWSGQHRGGVSPPAVPAPPAAPAPPARPPAGPSTPPVSTPNPSATPGWAALSGGYFGAGNAAGANRFATWRGTNVPIVGDYTAGTWSDIANPWTLTQWRGRGVKVDLAVWMFPAGTNVADVIAGRYDSYYRQLGAAVASFGVANVALRIGWEMNGDWYAWGAGKVSSADYVAAWRRIVTLVRGSAPGAIFTWCPTAGKLSNSQVESYYPGDAYTTFVGLDTYDNNGGWTNIRDGVAGLRWQRDFAAAHGKPVAFPEWGLVDGGNWGQGDDAQYITNMATWIDQSNVAYDLYFEFDAPDGRHALQNGQYPQGAARYQALF
jgi:hypothetical protein